MKNKKFESRFLFTEVLLGETFDPNAEFEILTTAKQVDSRYGEFQYSKAELQEMADNFNQEVVGTEIAVDHDHGARSNGVALGWIKPKSMRVAPSKRLDGEYSLYAKLHRFTPSGEEYISTGALRYFSVELQFKMERMIKGAKKIFKNVIRGLALTNRPVVKDMQPTYSENINNPIKMDELNKMFQALAGKDKISKAEFSEFKKLAEEAVEADESVKEDVEAKTSELSEKVAEEKSDEGKKEFADKELVEAADAAVKKALAESGKKEFSAQEVAVLLADATKEALKEPMKKLNEALDGARTTRLSAEVESLTLSEDRNVGFKADSKDKILDFVKKLSDELAKEYFEIHKDVIAGVDFSEHGKDEEPGAAFGEVDAYKELDEKASKYAEENKVSYAEATKAVLASDEKLRKAVEKAEEPKK